MKGRAYILVVIGILMAKAFGFLRDIVFASSFGASELTDIYFQIFSVASLVFTGIGSALSTLVIKNLNKPENLSEQKKKKYVSEFITKTSVVVLFVIILLYIFAGQTVKLLLPGINPGLMKTAVNIMYIMLPSCLFITVAYIMAGVLQNLNVFFITSIMSLPYNAVIIGSLVFGNISITAVSAVTTLGWFLHIIILLPSFLKKGYRLFGNMSFKRSGSRDNKEALYIFISGMMFQLIFMADKASVSQDSGAASMVNYASNLFVTISSVFVVAMSNVSYPSVCRYYESGDNEQVKKVLCYIITLLFAIFLPFLLTACCFGKDIIALIYERGEFTSEMTSVTAALFSIYSFGIFGYICQDFLNKILYLDKKYVYTVCGALGAIVLKLIVNSIISPLGTVAVALSTAVIFMIYAAVILIAIIKVIGNFFSGELISNLLKISLGGIAAFIGYIISVWVEFPLSSTKLAFLPALVLCGILYGAVLLVTGLVKYIIKNQQ